MNKKHVMICSIAAAALVACAWLLVRPKPLGNIRASIDAPETSACEFSFRAEKGERVRLSFQSRIDAGDLEIRLYDSEGRERYVLDHAKALKTFYTFDRADIYTLKAEYTDFAGDFKVTVYPAK